MSRLRRDIYRRKLQAILEVANDEELFVMVWAVDALQSGEHDSAARFLLFPREAITTDLSSPHYMHKWKLETLLNEALATRKLPVNPNGRNRKLNCKLFATVATLINTLTKLENAEDGITLERVSILKEMHRLAQRQFEWQKGFISRSQLHRAGFVYGGPLTGQEFSRAYGFSTSDLSLCGFAMQATLLEHPGIQTSMSLEIIRIPDETRNKIVAHISLPYQQAREFAAQIRSAPGHTAYKRSLFRTYPFVLFGDDGNQRIRAPLRELIMLRCTAGLFYDIVRLGDDVKNEVSRRFEQYCLEFFRGVLPSHTTDESYKYRARGNMIDTPDILVRTDGAIELIVECKATRMSYEARFAEDPVAEARRGYHEIARGVFQIWRFYSHHRRGLLGTESIRAEAKGVVLTLDTWLMTAATMQQEVLELARQIATEKDPGITDEDRIPVVFTDIEDLESAAMTTNEASLLSIIGAASEPRFAGWELSGVRHEIVPNERTRNPHPFEDRVAEVVPWWNQFGTPADASNKQD